MNYWSNNSFYTVLCWLLVSLFPPFPFFSFEHLPHNCYSYNLVHPFDIVHISHFSFCLVHFHGLVWKPAGECHGNEASDPIYLLDLIDLKGKCSETGSATNRSLHNHHHHHLNGNHYGHTGGVMLSNVKSTNKDTTTSSSVSPTVSANVDDCARTSNSPQSLRAIIVWKTSTSTTTTTFFLPFTQNFSPAVLSFPFSRVDLFPFFFWAEPSWKTDFFIIILIYRSNGGGALSFISFILISFWFLVSFVLV